ncbi:MAG: dihydroorotate dehydrogenase electron transfer subunit [Armatimonadetes bacterium]|nr:dihydroorotate dehydrogenase electron transfer subunit [Armatimonadota bacterium]
MSKPKNRVIADCEIIEQTEIAPHVFRSALVEPAIARVSRPGQFVNVRVCDCYDPLLRRPFSVHAVDPEKGTFSLLYDVVGRGTTLLMNKRVGDTVNIVGPLGSSFDVGRNRGAMHVLVAGGCGAAPIHFLSDWICREHGCDNVTVLVGAKTGTGLLCEREFVAHGVKVKVATEDGSFGYKGLVTQLLQKHLAERDLSVETRVYSCGPMPMMREVARISHEQSIYACQLSLERAMACGVGVCMGCVVRACPEHEAACDEWYYSRICTDGPVYNAMELSWE